MFEALPVIGFHPQAVALGLSCPNPKKQAPNIGIANVGALNVDPLVS